MALSDLSPSDRDWVIRTLAGEAGSEPQAGQEAVAAVIKNRLENGSWGNTAQSVVLSPGQFSMWNGRTGYANGAGANSVGDRIQPGSPQYDRLGQIVDNVFSGKTGDPTNGALNYFAPAGLRGRAPDWTGGMQNPVRIGSQVFGTAPGENARVTQANGPNGLTLNSSGPPLPPARPTFPASAPSTPMWQQTAQNNGMQNLGSFIRGGGLPQGSPISNMVVAMNGGGLPAGTPISKILGGQSQPQAPMGQGGIGSDFVASLGNSGVGTQSPMPAAPAAAPGSVVGANGGTGGGLLSGLSNIASSLGGGSGGGGGGAPQPPPLQAPPPIPARNLSPLLGGAPGHPNPQMAMQMAQSLGRGLPTQTDAGAQAAALALARLNQLNMGYDMGGASGFGGYYG